MSATKDVLYQAKFSAKGDEGDPVQYDVSVTPQAGTDNPTGTWSIDQNGVFAWDKPGAPTCKPSRSQSAP